MIHISNIISSYIGVFVSYRDVLIPTCATALLMWTYVEQVLGTPLASPLRPRVRYRPPHPPPPRDSRHVNHLCDPLESRPVTHPLNLLRSPHKHRLLHLLNRPISHLANLPNSHQHSQQRCLRHPVENRRACPLDNPPIYQRVSCYMWTLEFAYEKHLNCCANFCYMYMFVSSSQRWGFT